MAKKKELSVWQFVANKKDEKENLKYICMDDKNRVAVGTNGKMLFVNPDEYVEFPYKYLEGIMEERKFIVVDEAGQFKEYTFPNWIGVVPKNKVAWEFKSDRAIKEVVKEIEGLLSWEFVKKTWRLKRKDMYVYLGSDVWMPFNIVKIMLSVGLDGWFGATRWVLIKQWEGKTLAFVQCLPFYGLSNKQVYGLSKKQEIGFCASKMSDFEFEDLVKMYREAKEYKNNLVTI